jgi:hypothetical protein
VTAVSLLTLILEDRIGSEMALLLIAGFGHKVKDRAFAKLKVSFPRQLVVHHESAHGCTRGPSPGLAEENLAANVALGFMPLRPASAASLYSAPRQPWS